MRAYRHLLKIFRLIRSAPHYKVLLLLQLFSAAMSFTGLPLLVPVLDQMEGHEGVRAVALPHPISKAMAMVGVPETFTGILLVAAALTLLGFALNFTSSLIAYYIQYGMYGACTNRMFGHFLRVNWRWMSTHHSGEMSHAIFSETSSWADAIFKALELLIISVQALSFFLIAFTVSWKGTLCVGAVFSVLLLANVLNSRRVRRISFRKNEDQREYAGFLNSTQQNKKFIKASGAEATVLDRFAEILGRIVARAKEMAFWNQLQQLWTQSFAFVVLVALLLAHRQLGLAYSQLLVLLLVFSRLLPQLQLFTAAYSALSQSLPIYDSVEARIIALKYSEERFGGLAYNQGSKIALRDVSFQYEAGRRVLAGVNLAIEARRTLAIVGSSGSGKSTVLDLLLGLVAPNAGRIDYGPTPGSELDYRSLRARVAYVSQDVTFWDGTLRSNLDFEAKGATREELLEACREVGLQDFVAQLPNGVETRIGENAVALSGGQRQRLALARALLRKPEILILDEATSALDLESELVVQEALERLRGKVTILLVAHRISTVRSADWIYVLEEGRVVEEGTFPDLLAKKGRFHALNSLQ